MSNENSVMPLLHNLLVQAANSNQTLNSLSQDVHMLHQALSLNRRLLSGVRKNGWESEVEKHRCYLVHELRNALAGICSCVEILTNEVLNPLERKEFLRIVGTETDRAIRMTHELAECRSEQSPEVPRICAIPAKEILDELMTLVKCQFGQCQITCNLDAQYSGTFQGDREKIQQVFLNLAYNARDSMPEGGVFKIRSRQIDEMVLFEFSDTGCGMTSDVQARLYTPRFTEGKPCGTGLGMAIVKDILDEHHGTIEVESTVGKGTIIRIALPQQ